MAQQKEINYGVLSDVSRDLNCGLIGDCSGSTISRRTTKGFKNVFNLDDNTISDQNAEHIVHAAMIGTVSAFASKKESGTVTGILLLASLVYFYQNA